MVARGRGRGATIRRPGGPAARQQWRSRAERAADRPGRAASAIKEGSAAPGSVPGIAVHNDVCVRSTRERAIQATKPAELVIAAVAGNESLGLKAVAPTYERERGIKLNIVEMPYPTLYEKLV